MAPVTIRWLLATALALGSAPLLGGCDAVDVLTRPDAPGPPRFEAGMAAETDALADPLWDDEKAEVAGYVTREARYGTLRDGEATLLTVKETFDAERLVKADAPEPPRHTVTVMKLNTVVTVPTGVYTYRQMASTFLTRAEARPVKLAVSSQEWCGTTSKLLEVRGDEASLRAFSYFGAEAERAWRVPLDRDTILADSLPLWLRTLDLERPGERRVRIVDEQLSNRARPPRARSATITVGTPESITVPADTFDTIPVAVTRGDRKDTFWLRRERPHTLIRWDRADGGSYRLRYVTRAPYWDMNGVEDVGRLDPRRGKEKRPRAPLPERPPGHDPGGDQGT